MLNDGDQYVLYLVIQVILQYPHFQCSIVGLPSDNPQAHQEQSNGSTSHVSSFQRSTLRH